MDIGNDVYRTFGCSFLDFMTCWPERQKNFLPMIQDKDISPQEIMDTFIQAVSKTHFTG